MNQVTPETTIGELCSYEEYKPLSDYFFTNMTEDVWRRPLGDYGFKKCGFEETLERIKALVLTGQPLIYPRDVYKRQHLLQMVPQAAPVCPAPSPPGIPRQHRAAPSGPADRRRVRPYCSVP